MRIAQFIDTDSHGGAERVLIDLCRYLRELGHDLVALHFGSDYLHRQCRRFGLREVIVPGYASYKRMAELPRFGWIFQRFLRDEGIEVLHSHLLGPIVGGAAAARLAGIAHVGTLHDIYSVTEKPQRVRLVQLAALLGTQLIAVSRRVEAFYRKRARLRSLKTIYNGVCLPRPNIDRPDIRRALDIGEQELVLLCVGRLVELKRHDVLLTAFAALATEFPVRLVLAGDGPQRQRLEQLAAMLNVRQKTLFLGSRDDVPSLLAAADIFVLSSDSEGLSCSILEAMAAGLPVAVTDVGGNAELVTHGENGFLIPPGDSARLTQHLRALLSDAQLRQRLGRASQRRAQSEFSMTASLQQYLELYRHKAGVVT